MKYPQGAYGMPWQSMAEHAMAEHHEITENV